MCRPEIRGHLTSHVIQTEVDSTSKKRGGREELIVLNLHYWRKETFQSQILFSPAFRLNIIIAAF